MPSKRKPLSWNKGVCIGFGHDASHLPSRRSGHSITMVGVNGYLFGGLDASVAPPEADGTMFVVRISPEDCEWKRLSFPAAMDLPMARWQHTCTQVNPTTLLLFGGCHSHDERLNDFWTFDTITSVWERRSPGADSGAAAGALEAAGARAAATTTTSTSQRPPRPPNSAAARTRALAAGSSSSSSGGAAMERRAPPEVYRLPVQEPRTAVVSPGPRGGHTACLVGAQNMWLFGGGFL